MVIFAISCRILPFTLITKLFLIAILLVVGFDFYIYTNKKAKQEDKLVNVTEFSWGFVKEKTEVMDFSTFIKYISNKDFSFYKTKKVNADKNFNKCNIIKLKM